MKGQNPNRSNSQKNGHRRSSSRVSNNSNSPGAIGNGNGNGNGSIPQSSSNQSINSNFDDQVGNNRLVYLLSKSVGKQVIATLTNGSRYQGLLLTSNGDSPLSIVLNKPILVSKSVIDDKSNIDNNHELPETLIIPATDLIDVEVGELDLNDQLTPTPAPTPSTTTATTSSSISTTKKYSTPSPSTVNIKSDESSKFKTDSDISGRLNIRERELERWVPDEDISHNPALSLTSDDHKSGSWDQFKVNEEKFGVESSYDEHLYTTRIDKSAADYHEKVKLADQIAREIEGQSTTNSHMLEERGVQVDDSGVDEEDKYSGVDRRGDELMAALRNASISNESINNTSPASLFNKSTSISGPGKYVPPRQRAAQYHNDPAIISSSATNKLPTSNSPISSPPIHNHENAQSAPTAIADHQPEQVKSTIKPPTTKPDSIPPKPQVPTQPHAESFRLNAQSEINSLREFSANFKIPHKMPTDLLPILTKDKIKQDEILKKQTEQQVQKQKKEQEEEHAQTATTTANTSATAPESQKKKLDPTKPAFKLNPKAAVFTPSSKHTQLSPNPPKATYNRASNNPSPRMSNARAYSASNGSSSSSGKRYHQISPAEFFGGANKVPTKESQDAKKKSFQIYFNLFITTKRKNDEKFATEEGKIPTPIIYEKAFQTPPTWDLTIDESFDKLFPPPTPLTNKNGIPPSMVIPGNAGAGAPQFMPSPMMGNPSIIPTGYPSPVNAKYPLSPHQQQQQQLSQQQQQQQAAAAAMAHFQQQQQQFHAAMLYQQQFPGAIPPGQPPMTMYAGADPTFLPPGGFMPPPGGYVSGGSPVNGNLMLGGAPNYNPNNGGHNNGGHHGYNNSHHHTGGRRYSKRGGHNN